MKTTPNICLTAVILLGLGLAVFVAVFGTLPSQVLPDTAPPTDFSAERAMQHLKAIAAEPRPTGSESNAQARAYILNQLSQMGLEPIIQNTTACGHYPKSWCANPYNLITKIDGVDSTDAILLVAHYDSQQLCPGASDDAYGVAVILETARAILAGQPLNNTLILLFTDAHEWNFQGAAAFVTQHPWAEQVRLVFAYDAAYSGGPASLMVYDPQSAWIINELSHLGTVPFANSMLVYFKDHPGGDLNAFQWHGYSGFEAGFWDSVYYHSSLDNIENFKPASLQHQGKVALEMVQHFGSLELDHQQEPYPVYFNLLHQWLVVYPADWVFPTTALLIMAFAGILFVGMKRRRLTWQGIGLAALAFLSSLPVSGLVVWLLFKVIPLLNPLYKTEYTANWRGLVYNQPWLAVASASLTFGITATFFILLQRNTKTSLADLIMGTLAILLVCLSVVSYMVPGASYLLTWPLLFSLVVPAYWVLAKPGIERPFSTLPLLGMLVSGLVTILLLVPLIMAAYTSLSPAQAYFPTLLLVVMMGFLVPHGYLLTERRQWLLPVLAGVVALGVLTPALLDEFDSQKPLYIDLSYVLDADQGKALWTTSMPLKEDVQALLFPQGSEVSTLPWLITKSPFNIADAPLESLPMPKVELIEDTISGDIRTLHLRFFSPRGSTILYATVTNPDLEFLSVTINGITSAIPLNQSQVDESKVILPEGVSEADIWDYRTLFYFEGLEAENSVDVILEVNVGEPVTLIVSDSSFGLPPSSQALLDALPSYVQLGHAETTVYTAVSFNTVK